MAPSRLRLESLKLSLMDTKLKKCVCVFCVKVWVVVCVEEGGGGRGRMHASAVKPVKSCIEFGAHAFAGHLRHANRSAGGIRVGVEIIGHARGRRKKEWHVSEELIRDESSRGMMGVSQGVQQGVQ